MSKVQLYEIQETRYEIRLNMQNKPNLQNDEMNVSASVTKDYKNFRFFSRCKNKANQTQFWLCISPMITINGRLNIIDFLAFSSAFGGQVPATANRLAAIKTPCIVMGQKLNIYSPAMQRIRKWIPAGVYPALDAGRE